MLADADFFIALYKKDDSNHKRALAVLEKIQERGLDLALSVFVYGEITTVLSMRVSQSVARHFMNDTERAEITIIHPSERLFEESKKIFRSQRSKNVSFVDAANIALFRLGNFQAIVSFDTHYRKNGLLLFN